MDDAESNAKLRFIVTFGHRPPFSSGYHASDLQLREFIGKLASDHPKYVLNLNGHSHDYERTKPFHGLISVTVGTGGATLEQNRTPCLFRECPQPSWSQFRKMHLGFLSLQFSPDRIKGEFICGPSGSGKNDVTCDVGSVVDRFIIIANKEKRKKRPGATR